MSNEVRDLLSDPLKGTNRAQGVLSYLFRHVLLWRRVNQFTWNKRAKLYFEKPHNKDDRDRGNLNKSLVKDDFTWGAFKKAIDFLNPHAATFIVELTWRNGLVSRYPIKIDVTTKETDEIEVGTEKSQSEVFSKGRDEELNTLARLFRQICAEEEIDLKRWEALFQEWAAKSFQGLNANRRDINMSINQLQRYLLGSKLTWKNFRRGIAVLAPVQERYILELQWSSDTSDISRHEVTIRDPLNLPRS